MGWDGMGRQCIYMFSVSAVIFAIASTWHINCQWLIACCQNAGGCTVAANGRNDSVNPSNLPIEQCSAVPVCVLT